VLEEIRIRGLGVIDDAVLDLSPGLTVVTGETGTGKTMVMTGLGLLFGGRADSALVRAGADRTVVEGHLRVDPDGPVAQRARDAGGELDDDVLLLGRTVSAEGRSRAYVGGRAAPVSVLGELAEELIAVHGQHDQQRLLRPARQRASLDRYAGEAIAGPLMEYRLVYHRLRAISADLTEIVTRARERAQEADLLRLGLEEIEAAAPQPGEDAALAAEIERLAHADALRTAATTAHAALLGDPAEAGEVDAATLVGAARRALDGERHHDAQLAALAERLAEAGYLLSDVAGDLASYAAGIDADPLRLQTAQERRSVLTGLTRKYGDTVADVLAWSEQAAERLAALDGDDDRVARLQAEHERLRAELGRLAAKVSAARTAAALLFGAAVTAELTELAMRQAELTVAVTQADAASVQDGIEVDGRLLTYGPDGVDDVELLLSPHAGSPTRPLQRGASGGELSRVMLAVEVVFAGADPVPTFVFDEVDAGVGGKAAVELGRRLARLARTAQVLVVTHLPQVAAFADRHLMVEKSDDGRVTTSGVTTLEGEDRVRELSRMLAGLEDSDLAMAHAEELLDTAAAAKAG